MLEYSLAAGFFVSIAYILVYYLGGDVGHTDNVNGANLGSIREQEDDI